MNKQDLLDNPETTELPNGHYSLWTIEWKICKTCNEPFTLEQFSAKSDTKDKLCASCKNCERQRISQWYIMNKDKRREYDKERKRKEKGD